MKDPLTDQIQYELDFEVDYRLPRQRPVAVKWDGRKWVEIIEELKTDSQDQV